MDQIRKFGEQTSRILEFKPEGLEGYKSYFSQIVSRKAKITIIFFMKNSKNKNII